MRKLLWKEWHEQAWKLAFGCVVLSAMAAIGLRARMVADATLSEWVCFVGLTLLPVLASTGGVPAERAEGGFEALLALPVAAWQVLAVKTAAGLLLCAGPLAAAAAVGVAMAGGREVSAGLMLGLYGRTAGAAAGLFVWMFALTVRLPSEARAALLAMGVLVLWTLASTGLLVGRLHVALAASPLALVCPVLDGLGPRPAVGLVVAVQVPVLAAVWLLALRLFVTAEDPT